MLPVKFTERMKKLLGEDYGTFLSALDEDAVKALRIASFKADAPDNIDELCKICGVGPKVASCALLFGHSKLDAFPIDVWIKKVIAKYFDNDFDPQNLGEYAGVAQQYLFYYERYLQN